MAGDYAPFPTRVDGVDYDHASDVNAPNVALGRIRTGRYNVLTYGAIGDGVTNDAAAIASADSTNGGAGVTEIYGHTYLIGTNETLAHALDIAAGAQFSIASGVTLTLGGDIEAGAYQVFTGAGLVVIGAGGPYAVRAEWWGAVAANSDAANATAVSAAFAAIQARGGGIVTLGAERWISGTRGGIISTAASGATAVATLTGTPYAGPALGGNLVQNGDFSNGSVGWVLDGTASVDTNPADAPPGSNTCLKQVATALFQFTSQTYPVLPNTVYSAGFYAKTLNADNPGLKITWQSKAGVAISAVQTVGPTNPTAYTFTALTATSPGNAVSALVQVFNTTASAQNFYGRIGMVQGSTYTDAMFSSNPIGNKSLVACEATTNLLSDGDCEGVGGTTTAVLFNDSFANANAWTSVQGTAVTAASNILTVPAGTIAKAGHPDWWDTQASGGTSTCQVRLQPQTGFTEADIYLRFIDTNNTLYVAFTTTNMILYKVVAGVRGVVNNVAYALIAGTSYWLTWTISGTTVTAVLHGDGATPGAGATLATVTSTVSDTILQTGKMGAGGTGASLLLGQMGATAYSGVCQVSGPIPSSVLPIYYSGEPAFCWSKAQSFSGTYSLGIYCNDSNSHGRWRSTYTLSASTSYSLSARIKTASASGTAYAVLNAAGTPVGTGNTITGTTDWTVSTISITVGTTAQTNADVEVAMQGIGEMWGDILGLESKAYQTLNLDPFPAFYVPTGTRAAAYASVATPVGMTASWTVALTAIPRIAQTVTPSQILWTDAAANYHIYFNYGGIRAGFAGVGAPAAAYTVGNAYRIVLVFSQGVGQLYVNGVSTGAAQVAQPILPSSTFLIGSDGAGATLDGNISGLVIASRAWSAAEVASDYANPNPPGLISGGGLFLQPGQLYVQTPDATGNSLALPAPVGGRTVSDVERVGTLRTGNIQPLEGQSVVGIQGMGVDAAGLLQVGGLKVLAGESIGTTQTTVNHLLGRVPNLVIIKPKGNAVFWESAPANATSVFITASVAATCDILVA